MGMEPYWKREWRDDAYAELRNPILEVYCHREEKKRVLAKDCYKVKEVSLRFKR